MAAKLPILSDVGREAWDRAHATHHINEVERQVGLLEFHAARVQPTAEGCEVIDRICARLQAVKGALAIKDAA